MAEISKQALKVDNNQSFPNNNNGAITPSILRAFNTNMIDSLVDEQTYNVDSASWNQQIDSLEGFTGSLTTAFVSTASFNAFTQSTNDKFNTLQSTTSSIENSISALNNYTASDNSAITNLNQFTSSQLSKDQTLATYTASVDAKFNTLGTQSGSWITETESGSFLVTASVNLNTITFTKGDSSTFNITVNTGSGGGGTADLTSLNAFTSSQLTINAGYNTTTASLLIETANLELFSASTLTRLTNIETTTASLNSSVSQLNANTASQQSQINSLISATASYANSASVAAVDAAQQSQINALIASTSSADNTSLNAFTASQLNINTGYNTFTSSANSRLNNLESTTASLLIETQNLELFSASALVSISNLNQSSASQQISIDALNSFSASQLTKDQTLATYTGSNDTKWNTLGGQSGSWITESETGSFARYDVSNPWSADQTFTNISAVSASFQYVQTIFETASVIYSSGSNQFGDEITDIQTLIGQTKVSGSLGVTGSFYNNTLRYPIADNGAKSFIQSDGAGTLSLQYVDTIWETIRAGENVAKGTPLYISGSQGANPIVYAADASNPDKMPVTYIAGEAYTANNTYPAIVLGLIEGMDLTGYTEGQTVYVAEGGGWTSNLPSGSNSITQVLGVVTKGGSGGKGLVLNPGPAALPGLQTGYVWVGNGNNRAVAVSTSSLQTDVSGYTTTASFNSYTSSTNGRLTNIESTTASLNSSISQLNQSSASQQVSIDNLNTNSASVNISIAALNNSSASQQISIDALNQFSASQQLLNGTFATTGSNTFVGQQTIQNNLVIEEAGNPLIYTQFIQDPLTNKLQVNQTGASGVNLNVNVSMQELTASLTEGYAWVGGVGNVSKLVATSSFIDTPINTGSFATTGSNTFYGNQSIQGTLYISSSTQKDVIVEGQLWISSSNLFASASTVQPQINLSGPIGGTAGGSRTGSVQITPAQVLFNRGSRTAAIGNTVINVSDTSIGTAGQSAAIYPTGIDNGTLDGNEIGLTINGTILGVTNFGGPSIWIADNTLAYKAVFGFQDTTTYTDGRVAVLTPLSASAGFTASLQNGYAWVGNSLGQNTQVATSSFVSSTLTGSFATTGSNTFIGNQTITGSVFVSGNVRAWGDGYDFEYGTFSSDYLGGAFNLNPDKSISKLDMGGNQIAAIEMFANGGNYDTFKVEVNSGSQGILFQDYPGAQAYSTFMNVGTSADLNNLGAITLSRPTTISGSLSVSGSINGNNTFRGNQIISGTFIQSGSNSIMADPIGQGVGTWIKNRVLISDVPGGPVPRLFVSGSDGAFSEFGRGFINQDTRKVPGLGAFISTYGPVNTNTNNTVAVANDDYSVDVEIQLFASTSSVGLADWDNGSTFSYVPLMSLAPNNGDNPPVEFKRDVQVTGSVSITEVMNLKAQNPLPTGNIGDLAVSGSHLYFYNGAWTQLD